MPLDWTWTGPGAHRCTTQSNSLQRLERTRTQTPAPAQTKLIKKLLLKIDAMTWLGEP